MRNLCPLLLLCHSLFGSPPSCETAAHEIAERLRVFQDRPFARDQFVRIGGKGKDHVFSLTQAEEETRVPAGALGRIFREHPNGTDYIVFLPWSNPVSHHGDRGDYVNIPKELIFRTPTGTGKSVTYALQSLLSLQLSFQSGERVRYRNHQGLIHVGIFEGETDGYALVTAPQYKTTTVVPIELIFKDLGKGDTFTPRFAQDGETFQYKAPVGVALDFLNGAAKLTSLPDFIRVNDAIRFVTIANYVHLFLEANPKLAEYLVESGVNDVGGVVSCGVATCFQERVLISTILQEAGYRTLINGNLEPTRLSEYSRF